MNELSSGKDRAMAEIEGNGPRQRFLADWDRRLSAVNRKANRTRSG
jgi:hypothetical protein